MHSERDKQHRVRLATRQRELIEEMGRYRKAIEEYAPPGSHIYFKLQPNQTNFSTGVVTDWIDQMRAPIGRVRVKMVSPKEPIVDVAWQNIEKVMRKSK